MRAQHVVLLAAGFALAAVFAALWYGACVENKMLKAQAEYLGRELEAKVAELASAREQLIKTSEQLIDTQQRLLSAQRELQETQMQLQNLNATLADVKRQLEQTRAALRETTAELERARSQIAELERQRARLLDQLSQLNATYLRLRERIYGGYELVQRAKALLGKISLRAPQVGDTWTFVRTYNLTQRPLRSGYYRYLSLELYSYETVEVWTSEPLLIMFFTPDEYERWREGYSARPLVEGRGYVRFTPPRNGTYVRVIYNDLGRDVGEFQAVMRYSETWHYYDVAPLWPAVPYVVGALGTPSREFFRIFAVYNYWLENRHALAEEVMRQLEQRGAAAVAFSPQPRLDIQTLYALSLAALLRSAGFNVSFTAIGTSWKDPLEPSSIIVAVRFFSHTNPNATFSRMFEQIPAGWMQVMWTWQPWYVTGLKLGDFYVLINTYNIVEVVDRGLKTTTPFNVIYVDGITALP